MLTPQQETFCQKYIELNNASEAYRIAFPNCNRWQPETVHKRASELKLSGEISGRIKELSQEVMEKARDTVATAVEVLEAITKILRDDDQKTPDKLKAAELLGKKHKLFTDRVETEHEFKNYPQLIIQEL